MAEDPEHPGFIRVPITTIRPDIPLEFRVFAEICGELLLYSRPGSSFGTSRRSQLLHSGSPFAFIATGEREQYFEYLENNITALLDGPAENTSERVTRCYSLGHLVTKRLMDDPGSPGVRTMTLEWIDSTRILLDRDEGVLAGFVRILDVAPDLFQHSLHSCLYGLALAREIEIGDAAESADLAIGLLLHDVGHLLLPEYYGKLSRPLTGDEINTVRQHPRLGYEKVEELDWIGSIAKDVILNHHERPDGNGYPSGKRTHELTRFAKLASIVNTFDALTTNRPYREAVGSMEVLQRMIRMGPNTFDMKILATFVRMLSQ